MKVLFSITMLALLLCSCGKQNQDAARDKRPSAELIERQMAQFAASNNAVAITDGPTNWVLGLTVDVENAFKRDGKPVVVEVVFPDVRRDESGSFFLEGEVTVHALMMRVRVEALIYAKSHATFPSPFRDDSDVVRICLDNLGAIFNRVVNTSTPVTTASRFRS